MILFPFMWPVCGERVVDIIYGTGDMTESLLFEKEQKVSVHFLARPRKRTKRVRYPQGPLDRGMQKIFRRDRRKILCFGIAGRRDELFNAAEPRLFNRLAHRLIS